MASEFQRDKLVNMFRAFDADGNGYLDRSDFEALAERWRGLPRVRPGSELAARVDSVMLGWWDLLAAHVDTDGDGMVDLDELLAMVDLLPTMREAVQDGDDHPRGDRCEPYALAPRARHRPVGVSEVKQWPSSGARPW